MPAAAMGRSRPDAAAEIASALAASAAPVPATATATATDLAAVPAAEQE